MKKNYVLFAILSLMMFKGFAQPSTAPTTPPARSAGNVLSIYGTVYTNHVGTMFDPNWGQSGFGSASTAKAGKDTLLYYPNFNYQGIDFGGSLNVSSMTSVHIDLWSANCSKMDFYLIDAPTDHEKFYTITLTPSAWNSVDIPLSTYSNLGVTLNNIIQFKLVSNTPAASDIYVDNLYFWKSSNVPTITGFTIPAHSVGDAPFTLTDPTSNSTGAFTYTSSDSTVATISGKTVTIVGGGTTTITATQAAAGSYVAGTASATLVVNFPVPTSAAPTPTKSATNVISLWGNVYTNVDGINWFPGWGQATTFTGLNIGGDTTLEYASLNYEGVQATNPIDISKATNFHLDIWTPNAGSVVINLINSALVTGGGANQVGDTVILTKLGWNSLDIPMTKFKGLDFTKVDQVMFVGVTPATGGVIYLQNIYFWATSPLSVTLSDFKATKVGSVASLTWKSLSEVSNKGYDVQRSTNGTSWASVKFVAGKGSNSTYIFVDNNTTSGVTYYRLGIMDANGKVSYSSTVSVDFAKTNVKISFYPNPVKDRIIVTIPTIQSSSASLSLVNLSGKTVKTVQLTQGFNSNVSFDMLGLSKGIYILALKDSGSTQTTKVVVQ